MAYVSSRLWNSCACRRQICHGFFWRNSTPHLKKQIMVVKRMGEMKNYCVGISYTGYIEVEVEADCENVASYEAEKMVDDMDERELVAGLTIIATEYIKEIDEPNDEQMSKDDIDMIRWLKSASPKELRKMMKDVEREIFRDQDINEEVR